MTTVKFLCIVEIKIPNDKLLDGAAERAAEATLDMLPSADYGIRLFRIQRNSIEPHGIGVTGVAIERHEAGGAASAAIFY
jgi:hypothetical protein